MTNTQFEHISAEVVEHLKGLNCEWKSHAQKTRAVFNQLLVDLDTLKGGVFSELKAVCTTMGFTHVTPNAIKQGWYGTHLVNALCAGEIPVEVQGTVRNGAGQKIDTSVAIKSTIDKMGADDFYRSSPSEVVKFVAKSTSKIINALHEGVKEVVKAELVYDLDDEGKKKEFPSKVLVKFETKLGNTVSKEDKLGNMVDSIIKNVDDVPDCKLDELAYVIAKQYPEKMANAQDRVLDEAEAK